MTPTSNEITVHTRLGDFTVKATRVECGLALHHGLRPGKDGNPRIGKTWVVTHVNTGRRIDNFAAPFRGFTRSEAEEFFESMTALGDWSQWKTKDLIPPHVERACKMWTASELA
jgi:hypothetical protein